MKKWGVTGRMGAKRLRFGEFEFDVSAQELRRKGNVLRLQAQPAQVLACLLQRAGQLVTREELQAAVWGGDTHVDFEGGLNFCIAQVRLVLGDDAGNPRFLQTVPKRGYRFFAPIEEIAAMGEEAKSAVLPRRFWGPWVGASCGAILLLAVGGGAGYLLHAKQRTEHNPIVAVARFDNETGDASRTQFSDNLTDLVVEQLASHNQERFEVIGNAAILRSARAHRDLNEIANRLHAGYVVLGQVQGGANGTRILAHLIRLPEQTHLWVVRNEGPVNDSPATESEVAQKIAAEFSWRIIQEADGKPLPALANR